MLCTGHSQAVALACRCMLIHAAVCTSQGKHNRLGDEMMQAGIQKLHIEGRLRITFDPLVTKLPVIGAIKVAALPAICSSSLHSSESRMCYFLCCVVIYMTRQALALMQCRVDRHCGDASSQPSHELMWSKCKPAILWTIQHG